jgi:acetylornithine aminotransferase
MHHIFPFPGRKALLPDIVRAENCTLTTADGRQYTDLESGIWCTGIGHSHPAVRKALVQQLDKISHVGFCYSSEVVDRAAGVVLDLLDHAGGKCTFLCSGSEAVEYGIRVIRTLHTSPKILTMIDSYCGAYGDAACKSSDSWHIFDWSDCKSCDSERCETTCPLYSTIAFAEIGAFLFEPGSSSGLVHFPPKKLISRIVQDISAADGLIMVNEVTTGMGRIGKWFGYQHYDMQPHIVALGKGVGNGYPVSVASLNSRIVSLLDGKPIAYGQSHLNDPLGAAVAEAVIRTIQENKLVQRGADISKMLFSGLQRITSSSKVTAGFRGRGLMAVLIMEDHLELSRVSALHEGLLKAGFILDHRPGTHLLRMDPALTIDEEDLHRFLAVLEETLKAMESELGL